MIAHAINNDTSQNEIAKKVLATLESANRQVSIFINKTKGVETKKRYNEIKKYVEDISKKLSTDIDSDIDVENWIRNELDTLNEIYSKTGALEKVTLPTLSQVENASTFVPYADNRVYDSYLKNVSEQFFNTWDSSVRTGYMTGMTTREIVRTVIGSVAKDAQVAKTGTIETLKNSLLANTRTALQSFAVETQCQFYEKNNIEKYEWLATLDRRTCLVCGSLDGKIFNSLKEIKNRPPFHMNCRCLILPYFEGLDDTRASKDGYVESVSYYDWLRNQPEEVQKDVLGKTRYEIFKSGKDIGTFINNNKIVDLTTVLNDYFKDSDTTLNVPLSKEQKEFLKNNRNNPNYKELKDIVKYNNELKHCCKKFSKSVYDNYDKLDIKARDEITNLLLASKKDAEYFYAYDKNMNKVIKEIGSKKTVTPKKADLIKHKIKSLICKHNHLSGFSFSLEDIESYLGNPQMEKLYAVGYDNSLYELHSTDLTINIKYGGEQNKEKLKFLYDKNMIISKSKYSQLVKQGLISKEDYDKWVQHSTVELLCKDIGLKYKRSII